MKIQPYYLENEYKNGPHGSKSPPNVGWQINNMLLLLVITFSRLIFNPACGQLNRGKNEFSLSPFAH